MKKVILISIDGLRSDGMRACGNPYVHEMEKMCAYTYDARSLMPTVTLPCHFSMIHSVIPQRHGILTNTYVPQVRPVKGIFEKIREAGGTSAMYYGWEEMRDMALPGALTYAVYMAESVAESVDTLLTEEAAARIRTDKPDFVFLYLVETDSGGHGGGWMSAEYMRRASIALDCTKRIMEEFGDEYTVLVTSDHGGHDRVHGTDMPEDMVIPLFCRGEGFTPGETLGENISLLDIAPTIAKIMGVSTEPEWEGRALL